MLEAGQERNFGPKDGLEVGNVMAIHGRGSEIWIGGEFGLQQFDRGRFHTIRAIGDESLRGIVGIVETANGDLWLNGLGGIVHIRREEILKSLEGPRLSSHCGALRQAGGAPGPAVTAAAHAHGDRRHGWAPLVRREQRRRVARSNPSFEPDPVASGIDPVGDRR